MLCYAMLCYAMLCYAMLCYAMLCCAVLCCAMLCSWTGPAPIATRALSTGTVVGERVCDSGGGMLCYAVLWLCHSRIGACSICDAACYRATAHGV
jgi:hypothetical protein